jgi:hypothetical protein
MARKFQVDLSPSHCRDLELYQCTRRRENFDESPGPVATRILVHFYYNLEFRRFISNALRPPAAAAVSETITETRRDRRGTIRVRDARRSAGGSVTAY